MPRRRGAMKETRGAIGDEAMDSSVLGFIGGVKYTYIRLSPD